MRVQEEIYYHLSYLPEIDKLFRKKDNISWNIGVNTRTHLLNTPPSINPDKRGLRNMIHYLKTFPFDKHSPEMLGRLQTLTTKVLRLLNNRYMELVFETVRKENFPELPSRKSCLFLTSKEYLKKWNKVLTKNDPKRKRDINLYKLNVTGIMHKADCRWYEDLDIEEHQKYVDNAQEYWSGNIMNHSKISFKEEILFQGKIKVVERFNDFDRLDLLT